MDVAEIAGIGAEIRSDIGRSVKRIFQLSRNEFVFDLGVPASLFLYANIEGSDSRVYFVRKKLRELERASVEPALFASAARQRLIGAELSAVVVPKGERTIAIGFRNAAKDGDDRSFLVFRLNELESNIFLLDASGAVLSAARRGKTQGERVGEIYSGFAGLSGSALESDEAGIRPAMDAGDRSLSERIEARYLLAEAEKELTRLASLARERLKKETAKRERLIRNLESDLAGHGDPLRWKRFGDLLLANAASVQRRPGFIIATDFFDPKLPRIEIEAEDRDSPAAAAEKYFRRYARARNAASAIAERKAKVEKELEELRERSKRLEIDINEGNEAHIREAAGTRPKPAEQRKRRKALTDSKHVRCFISSDGFEILVGKKAADNDHLTFRMARSLDTWMHAADYPGSHVVIRTPNRKPIPQRTLLEAASLAAFYSQGNKQVKAAVSYTQRKFVHKPRGAAPGLVSLSKFKTVLVEPVVRIKQKEAIPQ